MINVEQIVAQQFPSANSRGLLSALLISTLRTVLREHELAGFAQRYPHLRGIDFIEQVLEYLRFDYQLRMNERHHIPASGPAVIVSNHPLGALDGLALLKMVHEIRPDVKIVANQLLLHIAPLRRLLLPVNNMQGGSARSQIRAISEFLQTGGVVIMFPAGEVSRMGSHGLADRRWNSGFLRLAGVARAPVIPVHIQGRNSSLFYSLTALSQPLSTLWLVREMFKQQGKIITLRIGEPVHYDTYSKLPLAPATAAQLFRKQVYRLGKNRPPVLKTERPIALPENRQHVRHAVRSGHFLGSTTDGKQIWLHHGLSDSPMLREIARLRELSFRAVGEGCGRRRDMDRYDAHYDHMLLWDDEEMEIVGAYRWLATGSTSSAHIENCLMYTHELFQFNDNFSSVLDTGLELGRSFIQPRYWRSRGLDYLWQGIGAYLSHHPEIRYLFGPVSISQKYPPAAIEMLVWYYRTYFGSSMEFAKGRTPFRMTQERNRTLEGLFTGNNQAGHFRILKDELQKVGLVIPPLYRQYTALCEPGGVQFVDFNIDPLFGNCVDGLVVVDLHKLRAEKSARYLNSGPCQDV